MTTSSAGFIPQQRRTPTQSGTQRKDFQLATTADFDTAMDTGHQKVPPSVLAHGSWHTGSDTQRVNS
jgi:hypothetical protein